MGTINYGTSDYITIGYNCNNIDYNDYDESIFNLNNDYYEIESLLMGTDFYYFHVAIKSGYYEGFYIDIEHNFPICYGGWEDKQAAQKEITQIKKFLLYCLDFGCCAVHPGWCMDYADYKTTLKEINAAVYNMREDVKKTPTYNNYYKLA